MRHAAWLAMVVVGAMWTTAALAQSDRDECYSLGALADSYKDAQANGPGAIRACTRLIEQGGGDTKSRAAAYRSRGSWNEKLGRLVTALADYEVAIRLEPRNVESYDYRADVLVRLNRLDEALADYDRATEIDPEYTAAHFSRGRIYERQGRLDKARAEYRTTLGLPTRNRIAQWAQDEARKRLRALEDKN